MQKCVNIIKDKEKNLPFSAPFTVHSMKWATHMLQKYLPWNRSEAPWNLQQRGDKFQSQICVS